MKYPKDGCQNNCMYIAKVNNEAFCTLTDGCNYRELGTGLEIKPVSTPDYLSKINNKTTDGWNISY